MDIHLYDEPTPEALANPNNPQEWADFVQRGAWDWHLAAVSRETEHIVDWKPPVHVSPVGQDYQPLYEERRKHGMPNTGWKVRYKNNLICMSDYTHIRNTAEFKVVTVHRSTYVPFRHYVSGAFQYLGYGSKGYRARAWYVQEKTIENRHIPDPVVTYERILKEALTSAGLIDDENLRGYHSTRVLADLRSSVVDMATMIAESGETIAYLGLLARLS